MNILRYSEEQLDPIVRFWNRNFAGKKNFFPITPDLFRERVVDRRTGIEWFDPAAFLLSVDRDRVTGIIHVGIRSEAFCATVIPDWAGGEQGYVALLCVDREYRRRGIGDALWVGGMNYLHGTKNIVVDGQCLNIFYGNSELPFTPFWGTTEGISVEWSDEETKGFFAHRGFLPRYKAVHLERDLRNYLPERHPLPQGMAIEIFDNILLGVGDELSEIHSPLKLRNGFRTAVVVDRGSVASSIVYYPMRELAAGIFAIYEMGTHESHQRKGIGSALLHAVLSDIKERQGENCQVLTVPDLSPTALSFYAKAGFVSCAEWAIF